MAKKFTKDDYDKQLREGLEIIDGKIKEVDERIVSGEVILKQCQEQMKMLTKQRNELKEHRHRLINKYIQIIDDLR